MYPFPIIAYLSQDSQEWAYSFPHHLGDNILFLLQFLQQDIPLFEGIISDLFPGVELPKPDYGALEQALIDNITKQNLQPVPWFIEKIIQVSRFKIYFVNQSQMKF